MASKDHQDLANFIKQVHQNLRLQSRALGTENAWTIHCQQKPMLQKYAASMYQLATEFWDKNNKKNVDLCRIHWVVHHATVYFHHGGLQKAQEREHQMDLKYFGKNLSQNNQEPHSQEQNLKLLDVGSCYNPFKKFPIFNVVAIDLVPATTDVLQCDFLSVDVVSEETTILPNSSCCERLLEASFDIVVFSLVLEYLPSPEQRYLCCLKAYRLLKINGLLFILTPDSKHATANSKVMKSWRCCLASLGFWRIAYQKLKHVHCMVYRKCQNPEVAKHWFSSLDSDVEPNKMIYIPQDFHEYLVQENDSKEIRSEFDNEELVNNFNMLSFEDVFS